MHSYFEHPLSRGAKIEGLIPKQGTVPYVAKEQWRSEIIKNNGKRLSTGGEIVKYSVK